MPNAMNSAPELIQPFVEETNHMTDADHDTEVAKVAKLAKDIRIAMLTTVDEAGRFVSRPMAQQEVEFDGDLWFFAERNSRECSQIAANPHVNAGNHRCGMSS